MNQSLIVKNEAGHEITLDLNCLRNKSLLHAAAAIQHHTAEALLEEGFYPFLPEIVEHQQALTAEILSLRKPLSDEQAEIGNN